MNNTSESWLSILDTTKVVNDLIVAIVGGCVVAIVVIIINNHFKKKKYVRSILSEIRERHRKERTNLR